MLKVGKLRSLLIFRAKAASGRVLYTKVFLKISQYSQENTCVSVSLLLKLQDSACNLITKEILAQVFFREFCEIFKNTFCRTLPGDCFSPMNIHHIHRQY